MNSLKSAILKLNDGLPLGKLQYWFKRKENCGLLAELVDATDFLVSPNFGERLYCVLNDITSQVRCQADGCSNGVKFLWLAKGYSKYCSYACSGKSERTLEARKKTNMEKYGTDNVSKLDSIKKLKEETTFKNFGVPFPSQSPDVLETRRLSHVSKFGHTGNATKESMIATAKRYESLVGNPRKTVSYDFERKRYVVFCSDCGTESVYEHQSTLNSRVVKKSDVCVKCNPFRKNVSDMESKMAEFLSYVYCGTVKRNDRKILKGKELDFLLVESNVGIELNGLYWHSDKFHDKIQHSRKTAECSKVGISLFQFFEDELEFGMEYVYDFLSRTGSLKDEENIEIINEKFGLRIPNFAELMADADFVRVSKDECRAFMEASRKRSFVRSDAYYGLYGKNREIVSAISVISKGSILRITGFSKSPGLDVTVQLGRLINDLSLDFPNVETVSFMSDRAHPEIDAFTANGFVFEKFVKERHFHYFKGKREKSDFFSKKNLYEKVLSKYRVPTSSNYANETKDGMLERLVGCGHEIRKVYDCGYEEFLLKIGKVS